MYFIHSLNSYTVFTVIPSPATESFCTTNLLDYSSIQLCNRQNPQTLICESDLFCNPKPLSKLTEQSVSHFMFYPSAGDHRGIVVWPDSTFQRWRHSNILASFATFLFLLFSASLTFLHAPHLSLTTLFLQHVGVLFEFSRGTVTTLCSVKNDSLDCNTSRGDARQETPFFSIDLCCHFEQTLYCRNCKILFPQYRILLCPLNNHSSWC